MDNTKSAWGMSYKDSTRAGDVADFCDSLWLTLDSKGWANAAGAAPRSRPSDGARSGLPASRFDRISQEQLREGAAPNKAAPRNHG